MPYELNTGPKRCLKCGHVRLPTDTGPDWACPKCGAVYAKVEEAERIKRTAAVDAADRLKKPTVASDEQLVYAAEMRRKDARERRERLLAHLV